MDVNQVTEYIYKELKEKQNTLISLNHQNAKFQEKIQQIVKETEQIKRGIMELQSLLKKAISDFKVDPTIFKDVLTDMANLTMMEIQRVDKSRRGKATITDIVFEILKETNHPLSIQEITEQTKRIYDFNAKRPQMSISSALLRDERFQSVGRGIWSLRTQEEKENQNDKKESVAESRENGATATL